ncbi:MAG: hypothetical protein AAGA77_19190 [Bacteroidota bacterium]
MESIIDQVVALLLVLSVIIYFIFCWKKGIVPSVESVLKICSFTLFAIFATILLLHSHFPILSDWLQHAVIPMTIVGILIISFVIQTISSMDLEEKENA